MDQKRHFCYEPLVTGEHKSAWLPGSVKDGEHSVPSSDCLLFAADDCTAECVHFLTAQQVRHGLCSNYTVGSCLELCLVPAVSSLQAGLEPYFVVNLSALFWLQAWKMELLPLWHLKSKALGI